MVCDYVIVLLLGARPFHAPHRFSRTLGQHQDRAVEQPFPVFTALNEALALRVYGLVKGRPRRDPRDIRKEVRHLIGNTPRTLTHKTGMA